jgi:hypothetical protein
MTRQHCELAVYTQGMPIVTSHLMLLKNHPLLPTLNWAIQINKAKLKAITRKYAEDVVKYDKCATKKNFNSLGEFLN